jgi:hypothetical protein
MCISVRRRTRTIRRLGSGRIAASKSIEFSSGEKQRADAATPADGA